MKPSPIPALARFAAALGLSDRTSPGERAAKLRSRLESIDADLGALAVERSAQRDADAARAAAGQRIDATAALALEHRAGALAVAREGIEALLAVAERDAAEARRVVLLDQLRARTTEARRQYETCHAIIAVAAMRLRALGAQPPSGLPVASVQAIASQPAGPRLGDLERLALEASGGSLADLGELSAAWPFGPADELPVEAAAKALSKLLGPPPSEWVAARDVQAQAAAHAESVRVHREEDRREWHLAVRVGVEKASAWRLLDRDADKRPLALTLVREAGRLDLPPGRLGKELAQLDTATTQAASADELHAFLGWSAGRWHP